jgi:PE family
VTEGIRVTPSLLEAAGADLDALAGRLGSLLAAFSAELAAFGRPWGQDDIGTLIGTAHDEVSSYAFECYQSAVEEVAAAGEDLAVMARGYRAADEATGRAIDDLRAGLDG